jgi:16S rRNA (cytidine1402-2'-O)-methyltransferase
MLNHHLKSSLYLVATPIGNLDDITFRALEVLKKVDLIAAEDTRHSKRLLSHYALTTPMISLHEHNEQQRIVTIVERLQAGESIALISDAGTPLISDPGARIVSAVIAAGFNVTPVPGACAAIAALTASGLACDQFFFAGFLPHKGAERRKRLVSLADKTSTIILYESVHRILNLLKLIIDVCGAERQLTVARELTKNFETFYYGDAATVFDQITAHPEQRKGEYVVLLEGCAPVEDAQTSLVDTTQLLNALLAELPLKTAVKIAVAITGLRRSALYDLALALSQASQK